MSERVVVEPQRAAERPHTSHLYINNHYLLFALDVGPVRERLRRVALVLRPVQVVVVFDIRSRYETAMERQSARDDGCD